MHGIANRRIVLRDTSRRSEWLLQSRRAGTALAGQLNMLWIGYDATVKQVKVAKRQLSTLDKKYESSKFWSRLPGIGLIRATTLFACLDTPWRFKQKNKLWKYCGVGLQRTTSGTDKKGRPKPARLKLPWAAEELAVQVSGFVIEYRIVTGWKAKGCPRSKKSEARGILSLDSELFIGV